jgi:DNA-binding response OmpR family regulator
VSPEATKVLLVEDEEDIRALVRTVLSKAGYRVTEAVDGREGLRALHQANPDIVVLDVGLPDLDGWQALERIRDMSDVPVMMLTARATENDKVRGLQAGADDYLTKPFGRAEFLARLEALGRRAHSRPKTRTTYADRVLRIDFQHRQVDLEGEPLNLTPMEFRLLSALVQHAGQVLSAQQLVAQAWDDPTGIGAGRVKFTVLRLRRKLGWVDPETSPIEAVRGFGYRYRPPAGP